MMILWEVEEDLAEQWRESVGQMSGCDYDAMR